MLECNSDGFNVYLAALPTGGWHRLMAGCNRKVREAWNRQQCTVTEAQSHNKGRGGETVTGVRGNVMGIQNKHVTEDMEKSGHRSIRGGKDSQFTRLFGHGNIITNYMINPFMNGLRLVHIILHKSYIITLWHSIINK